ncbi:MAG: metallophosphoesterase family protein [Planctomycetota bacterium]|nr:metallophosphoesterase family protein [Planctomycetota bacterium]
MPLGSKYGIIADIHANLRALNVALDCLKETGVQEILCLGDLMGFGSQPNECIDALKGKPHVHCVAGRMDRDVSREDTGSSSEKYAQLLRSARDGLSPSNARYLRELPETLVIDETFVLVHGSLVKGEPFILSPTEISRNLDAMEREYPKQRICFFGNTHIPVVVSDADNWRMTFFGRPYQ